MTDTVSRPHPRVIRIPAPAATVSAPGKKPNVLRSGLAQRLAIFVGLIILLWTPLSEVWNQASFTFRRFEMRPRLMRIADSDRIASVKSERAGAALAYERAYAADPHGIAFAFPQSDMAYYSRAPFLSYFDAAATPFYKITDPEALWRALRDRDVRYVIRPPFPLPELNNTAFDPLLADPRLTDIAYEQGGTRLLRVLTEPSTVAGILVHQEISRAADWSMLTSGKTQAATINQSPQGVVLFIPRDFLRDRNRIDLMGRGHPVAGATPAFRAPPGRLRITMEVTGRGRFDLLAVTATPDRATTSDTSVWSGVLLGKRRIISGQFLTPKDAASDADGRVPMGLTLWAYRADDITIHNWKVEWFPATNQPALAAPTKTASTTAQAPIAYVLRTRTAVDAEAMDALLAAGELTARVEFSPPPTELPQGAVICRNGQKNALTLSRNAEGVLTGGLNCWPSALSITWPGGAAHPAPRVVARLASGGEHVVDVAALSEILGQTPAETSP